MVRDKQTLWRLYSRSQNGWPPSRLFEQELRELCGAEWVAWASDLDNAIQEGGKHLEGRIQSHVDDKFARRGTEKKPYRPSQEERRDAYMEAHQLIVNDMVYRIFRTEGRPYAAVKPAAHDRTDHDLSDTVRVNLDR